MRKYVKYLRHLSVKSENISQYNSAHTKINRINKKIKSVINESRYQKGYPTTFRLICDASDWEKWVRPLDIAGDFTYVLPISYNWEVQRKAEKWQDMTII